MIDFTPSPFQEQLRDVARDFARTTVQPLTEEANETDDPMEAFRTLKPAYEQAAEMNLTFGHVPKEYGGMGIDHVPFMLVAEELCAVDPGFAGTLGVNALAQMPIMLYGSEDQKERWLHEPIDAIDGGQTDYIAGYVVSEGPNQEHGGTANFDHPSNHPSGMGLTAEYDQASGEYVLNGQKYWPANAAGWDGEGADQNLFVVRTDPDAGGRQGLSALIVPRDTDGIEYNVIDTTGMRTHQNVEIVCENAHVPEENLLAEGEGDMIINQVFSWSGPIVGILAVGAAREAFEYVLNWAKSYTAGGDVPIFEHQAVGYTLFDVAARIEACRALSWRAGHYIDEHGINAGAALLGAMTKVYVSETCVDAVYDCMQVMGVNSVSPQHPLGRIFNDVAITPLYDGGNMGMQRRKGWGVMADDDFDPYLFLENRDLKFTKDMEGWGTRGGAPPEY
jgi:alkylation response protein AidB-like acyl-CoA dehydrogenase